MNAAGTGAPCARDEVARLAEEVQHRLKSILDRNRMLLKEIRAKEQSEEGGSAAGKVVLRELTA